MKYIFAGKFGEWEKECETDNEAFDHAMGATDGPNLVVIFKRIEGKVFAWNVYSQKWDEITIEKLTFEQKLERWLKWVLYARKLGYDDYQARAWATFSVGWELSPTDKFNLLPKN